MVTDPKDPTVQAFLPRAGYLMGVYNKDGKLAKSFFRVDQLSAKSKKYPFVSITGPDGNAVNVPMEAA